MKIFLILMSCITPTLVLAEESPEWIHETARTIIGGEIIHWGTGEDQTAELALFKARQMAIKTIIEECGGFANKYITPRKQYTESSFKGYRAWAKVSVDFDACQSAKKAVIVNPNFKNPKIDEAQKLYDRMIKLQAGGVDDEAIKELQSKVQDYIRAEQNGLIHTIGKMQNDIDYLKAVQKNPQPVQPTRIPASSTQKQICWQEYQNMANDLTWAADEYNGNIAHPNLQPQYRAYMRKGAMCESMQ